MPELTLTPSPMQASNSSCQPASPSATTACATCRNQPGIHDVRVGVCCHGSPGSGELYKKLLMPRSMHFCPGACFGAETQQQVPGLTCSRYLGWKYSGLCT